MTSDSFISKHARSIVTHGIDFGINRTNWAKYFNEKSSAGTSKWNIKFGGILIAGIGFILTRLTVLPVIHLEVSLLQFIAGDIIPLTTGLSITLIGIALSISTYTRRYVNTIAAWCLVGTIGMTLVAGVIVIQVALYTGMPPLNGVWASSLFPNILLAGAIGGILIGTQSALNKDRRDELAQQSSKAILLNRLLRHEVLNKLAVIQGYTTQLADGEAIDNDETIQRIFRNSEDVQNAIDDIGFLTRIHPDPDSPFQPIQLDSVIREEIASIRNDHPNAEVSVSDQTTVPLYVLADDQLHQLFRQLFENAIQHNPADNPELMVSVTATKTYVEVDVTDNGPGLPDDQRANLEEGELPEYDDPATGFGIPVTKMLVSQYDGTVDVKTEGSGTRIHVTLPRADQPANTSATSTTTNVVGVDPTRLLIAGIAAIAAGIGMGVILSALTDTLPAIGGLYGIQSRGVGWILHLFHSVIFGLIFVTVVERTRIGPSLHPLIRNVSLGFAYGGILWGLAAGVIMPIWLNFVGIPSQFPFLTVPSLLGHVVWGVVLGGLYGLLVSSGVNARVRSL